MIEHGPQIIEGRTVLLDGNKYVGVIFKNCTVIYAGGPLTLVESDFIDCQWSFAGPAQNTVTIIRDFMTGRTAEAFKEMLRSMLGVSDAPKPKG